MTTIYIRHDVTTIAEVNALALTDRQPNDAIVLSDTGFTCAWTLPYRTRNEGVGRWDYDYDGVGHDSLDDGDKVTVLVPVEAEKIRAENRGGFFVAERHAADPFTAYYAHGEEA
ncbi:MAG: hypothetical protein ACTIA5_01520 [Brachybacterium tyrofermentans]